MERGWVPLVFFVFLLSAFSNGSENTGFAKGNFLSGKENRKIAQNHEVSPPRLLRPPAQSSYTSIHDNQKSPSLQSNTGAKSVMRTNTFLFSRPIPIPLVYKSTMDSGPVDESTFRKLEKQKGHRVSGQKNFVRNEISSNEFPKSDKTFQRRTIFSPPKPRQGFRPSKNLIRPKHFSRFPSASSITGFIATPGRNVQRISGTAENLLESTYFKGNQINRNDLQHTSGSTSSMTVIPAVVKSFPLKFNPRNRSPSSNLGSSRERTGNSLENTIFKRFTQHRPPNSISRNRFSIQRNPRVLSPVQPSNTKIFIFSKTPSENQPLSFWSKLLQIAPKLTLSNGFSRLLPNLVRPTVTKAFRPHKHNGNHHRSPSSEPPLSVFVSNQSPTPKPTIVSSPDNHKTATTTTQLVNQKTHVTNGEVNLKTNDGNIKSGSN